MSLRAIWVRHLLVLTACAVGIAGVGGVFQGAMDDSLAEVLRAMPLLLLGTWWAGRELGSSMVAARDRPKTRK